jgi:hypothetical protein
MHLLEKYALSTGSKINKPFIIKKYFPLPCSKYITIQNSSGMPAKCYAYFQEVINFLKPKLEKYGYEIIQIGSKDDRPLTGVIQLQGQTDINQTAFIIDNSKMHIGNDSFAVHMASSFNIPIVALYSVSSPEIAGPFWNKDNAICLRPPGNWKPSFNPNENPKLINTIKIETVANAIDQILFKESSFNLKTEFIGDSYTNDIFECLPDQIVPPNLFEGQMVNYRLDYTDNIENIHYQALLNNLNIRPTAIITDKPFDIKGILNFKKNLTKVIYNITNSINLEFINDLTLFNIDFICIYDTSLNSIEELNSRKELLIDTLIVIQEISTLKYHPVENTQLFYKTRKLLYADGFLYPSHHAYKKKIHIENLNIQTQVSITHEELIALKEELSHILLYSNNS